MKQALIGLKIFWKMDHKLNISLREGESRTGRKKRKDTEREKLKGRKGKNTIL